MWITRRDIRVRCPVCNKFYGVYDHSPERIYRHLDTCETLFYDIDAATAEYVSDDRNHQSLESYDLQFNKEERGGVKAIAMNMWDLYCRATKAYIPGADEKIVFDRFHLMRHLIDAVDKVRKLEHQLLKEHGEQILRGTKYLRLWSHENIPDWRKEQFD